MRTASGLALLLAVFLGVLSIGHFLDLSAVLGAEGPAFLGGFFGALPYLVLGLVLMVGASFAVAAANRSRRR